MNFTWNISDDIPFLKEIALNILSRAKLIGPETFSAKCFFQRIIPFPPTARSNTVIFYSYESCNLTVTQLRKHHKVGRNYPPRNRHDSPCWIIILFNFHDLVIGRRCIYEYKTCACIPPLSPRDRKLHSFFTASKFSQI